MPRRMNPSVREKPLPRVTRQQETSAITTSAGTATNTTDGFTTSGLMSAATPRITAMLNTHEP